MKRPKHLQKLFSHLDKFITCDKCFYHEEMKEEAENWHVYCRKHEMIFRCDCHCEFRRPPRPRAKQRFTMRYTWKPNITTERIANYSKERNRQIYGEW